MAGSSARSNYPRPSQNIKPSRRSPPSHLPHSPFLVKSTYNKVYTAVSGSATEALDDAVRLGLQREEEAHNLVFVLGFNTFGGVRVLFPSIMKWVGLAGEGLHKQLADETRTVVEADGGLTPGSLDKMSFTKSVGWEALRMEPPVPFQYAKAKKDIVIQSHDARFEIKKGEMIGYQPLATRDPKVFERANEFVADMFVGEGGEKLLKYVYWSNGRETEDPSTRTSSVRGGIWWCCWASYCWRNSPCSMTLSLLKRRRQLLL